MRWLALPLVGLLLSSSTTTAQAPEPRVTYCNMGFVGPFGQQRAPVNSLVEIKIADWHQLQSFDDIISVLETGYRAAAEYCRREHATNPLGDVSASVVANQRQIISARKRSGEETWSINFDLLPKLRDDEQKEAERQRNEAEQRRHLAEAQTAYEKRIKDSRVLFDEFNAKAQIGDWPHVRDLLTSPLAFRDKIVAVRAKYAANNLSDGNVFAIEGGLIYVSGVPATIILNPDQPLLIAGKVIGVKRIGWKGETISVPQLQFQDRYACKIAECEDVLFWMRPTKS